MFSKNFTCPVCKTPLGKRDKKEPIQLFHCNECQSRITIDAKDKIQMTLDKHIAKGKCGCGTCSR